jgi:dihydroorotate dehydrogenase (fumarate)
VDLRTNYLGLTLRTPFIVGASPLCDEVGQARRLQDAGAGAVVLRSLFEEQFAAPVSRPATAGSEPGEEAAAFPDYADYQLSPDGYVRHVMRLKRELSIPVIASLNGHCSAGWTDMARRLESAGADAIELNFYQVVTDATLAADQVEMEMLRVTGLVAGAVRIPVAVKLSPFHSATAQLALALELAGAAGVVIFNRFFQPDIDIDELAVRPKLQLSEPSELLLRLRWLAILAPQLRGSLAATGGVQRHSDAAKAILAGAHGVQLVSVLLRHGPHVLTSLADGLKAWMDNHGFSSLADCRGRLDLRRCGDAAAFERANYIHTLQSWRG